ncbi:MAG TPA: hypothetical protein VFI31_30630, partial [Pirellulales bacterium]|nr:hypothetical protein [Pirellulales bacterium]
MTDLEQPPDENPYRTPTADDDPNRAAAAAKSLSSWKIVRQLAGWGLLLIGLAGLILPILPGWFFIAWGVVTLAPDVPFFGRLLDRVAH